MKRNKFLMSLPVVALASSTLFAKNKKMDERTNKGFVVKAGEARAHGHIQLKGVNSNILDIKISGNDTDGGFALLEQTSLSQGRGTPLHVHDKQDEVFYVIEGEYAFQVGEDKFRLHTGDSIFLPMKVPHAWTQVSAKGKMTVLFQPAGKMEDFFLAISALTHEPTKEEMAKLFVDNEMKIVGPPLKIDKCFFLTRGWCYHYVC
jgi:quercetin dioxygenase-like cupin family protein